MFLRRNAPRRHPLLSFLIQVVIFLCLYFALRTWMQREMINGPAPDTTAITLNGQPISLRHYHGEPVLLHFWASWCKICKFEQGAITAIEKDWPVLTVAMQSGDKKEVAAFLKDHGLEWETLVDESGGLAKRFGVTGVPASFVIDGQGQIRFKEMGYTTSWGLRARLWLAKLMEEK
ncbi:MAG: protein disulfide oxidoreductase [Thiothrix sp.]|nr:MAG: protein disulfide oxidoreductase [Thiothrix sp.]